MIKTILQINSYRQSAICICEQCHKEFKRAYKHAIRTTKSFCSNYCKFKFNSSNKGKKFYHINRSFSKLGKKNPCYGKKYTPDEKRNIAAANFKKIKVKSNYKFSADRLWSRIILSKNKCEVCGKTNNLNPHHIIGRKCLILRHDLLNGICLCADCHTLNAQSAHQDPLWFSEWIKNKYPDRVEYLNSKKYQIIKMIDEDYTKIVESLRNQDAFYDK